MLRRTFKNNQNGEQVLEMHTKVKEALEKAAKKSSASLPDAGGHLYHHLYKHKKRLFG
jgi:hypothetical protein